MNDHDRSTEAADRSPGNDPGEGSWVGYFPVVLTAAEKRLLEAVRVLGSHGVPRNRYGSDVDYPAELDSLEEKGLLQSRYQGGTRYRGRDQGDGLDVYTLTESGGAWLESCHLEDE